MCSGISSNTTCKPVSPPTRGQSAAVVLFSGGSDSTLTASLLSEVHPVVHLITYSHKAMSFHTKAANSVAYLRKAHGKEKFVHSFLEINDLMDLLYLSELAADLRQYGTYALPMCCGACKLAMHVRSILYCHSLGARYAADGSNSELAELFPEQMRPVLELYRQLYLRYGIVYENPVFDVGRSDHWLFERGVTPKRDYKTEHVVYSNQHSCAAGLMLYGYTLGVALPLLGRSANKTTAERYIAAKVEKTCVPFLDRTLSRV